MASYAIKIFHSYAVPQNCLNLFAILSLLSLFLLQKQCALTQTGLARTPREGNSLSFYPNEGGEFVFSPLAGV